MSLRTPFMTLLTDDDTDDFRTNVDAGRHVEVRSLLNRAVKLGFFRTDLDIAFGLTRPALS